MDEKATLRRHLKVRPDLPNLPDRDEQWWADHVARVRAAADEVAFRRR